MFCPTLISEILKRLLAHAHSTGGTHERVAGSAGVLREHIKTT